MGAERLRSRDQSVESPVPWLGAARGVAAVGKAGGTRYLHPDMIPERRFNSRIEPPTACAQSVPESRFPCASPLRRFAVVLTESGNSDL